MESSLAVSIQNRVVSLRIRGEDIFHIRTDPPMTVHLQLRKRPFVLPLRHQTFGVRRINAQTAASQRDAENFRNIAELNERRHQRLHVHLEQLRLETSL